MGHRRRGMVVLFTVVVLVGALIAPAVGAAPGGPGGGGERFIVTTDSVDPPSERDLREQGASEVQPLEYAPNLVVVVATARGVEGIRALDGVVAVERDEVLTIQHHRDGHDECSGPPSQRPDHCDEEEGDGDDGGETGTGQISGTVSDANGGDPLEGATVAVDGPDLSDTTEGDGAYTITDVPEGSHDVTASADGYQDATETVVVTAGETTTADFALEPVEPVEDGQTIPWGIDKTKAPEAWKTAVGSGVGVCVADTGIDKTHEDLTYVDGQNFTTNNPHGNNLDPEAYDDGHGHGTHVAGTVAALDNQVGVVGVAHDADLYVAKVLRDNGSGYTSQIIDGLYWCADDESGAGAEVINMSFGGGGSGALKEAIKEIAEDGAVLVAASGNDGVESPSCPACYEDVIAIGATDDADDIASFSNRGEDVNAPGVAVLSTLPGDDYEKWSGTSMASPHAAGVAALIIETGITDPAEVREQLVDMADTIDGGNAVRINAAEAVTTTAE